MAGLADRRRGGWRIDWRAIVGVAIFLSAHPTIRLSAQVGHDPGRSPYRDAPRGSMVRVVAGSFSGTRGKVPVGPTDGPTGGVRYELAAGNLLTFAAGVAYAQTDAFFFDPNDSIPTAKGPINNDLLLVDLGLQASLTGSKTVRGFQPYVGAALGLVFGTAIGSDSSGYSFGTKFSYTPEVGLRWYPNRRLSVELGYRIVFYKLRYPLTYRPKLLPVTAELSETTAHPWAIFGVGWTF
ncbi:MAG: hypothetical protein ACREMF_09210 [Gemmatimonadales bacterium]